MSEVKRALEDLSVEMGFGGEITTEVLDEWERRTSEKYTQANDAPR